MANAVDARTWVNRGVFLLIGSVIMVIQLVPQSMEPWMISVPFTGGGLSPWQFQMVPPNLLLAVTLAWVVRRPRFVPVWMVALTFLMADLFFQRPPGLWAALVVILTEAMRKRSREFRTIPFVGEWGSVSLGIVAITIANRAILAIVVAPVAPFGLVLLQMILTIAIYPLVVVFAHYLFGISRITPGETGSRGQRV